MVRDEKRKERNGLKRTLKQQLPQQHTDTSLHPAAKSSQEDKECSPTSIPFRASSIYTSCSRPSASPRLPRGVSACPDVQLFMPSKFPTSSWPELHMLRFNRGGRHFHLNCLRLVENKEGKIDPIRSFNRPFIVSPPNWIEVEHLRWQNDVATCVYM